MYMKNGNEMKVKKADRFQFLVNTIRKWGQVVDPGFYINPIQTKFMYYDDAHGKVIVH